MNKLPYHIQITELLPCDEIIKNSRFGEVSYIKWCRLTRLDMLSRTKQSIVVVSQKIGNVKKCAVYRKTSKKDK